MKNLIFVLFCCFSICSTTSRAQPGACDTLFLTNGDTLLISINHAFFKKKILYNDCLEKGSRKSLRQSSIVRMGRSFLLESGRQPKRNTYAKLVFRDKKKARGKLYAVREQSVVLYEPDQQLKEYPIEDLQYMRIHKKTNKTLITVGCVIVGTLVGMTAAAVAGINNDSFGLASLSLGFSSGLVLGLVAGNALGSIGVKVNINGDQKTFQKQIKRRVKFY